jgi:tRNA threonylcarbamoyladenosine biosynthesis protein TsaE
MEKVFLSISSAGTKKIGKDFARKIIKVGPQKAAQVLALQGGLGSGKTTFLQGFAKGLGVEEKILSPTFVLMKRFKLKNFGFENFYHLDCYRLKSEEDILLLDPNKKIFRPENIVAIEWPEMIKGSLPENSWLITFDFISDKKRKITLPKI